MQNPNLVSIPYSHAQCFPILARQLFFTYFFNLFYLLRINYSIAYFYLLLIYLGHCFALGTPLTRSFTLFSCQLFFTYFIFNLFYLLHINY
jgi:hypothetical protein